MRRLVALSIIALPVLLAASTAGAYTVDTIQVTSDADTQFDPAVSNGKVAWTDGKTATKTSDIWVYDIGTKTYTQLLSDTTNASDQLLADINGSIVVYTDNRNTNTDIFQFDLAHGVETQISTSFGNEAHPRISSTGRIVWESDDGRVYSWDPAAMTELPINPDSSPLQQHPAISGSIAVWQEVSAVTGNLQIVSFNFTSMTSADITDDSRNCKSPDIDGGWVVYECADASGFRQIFAWNLLAGTETQITASGADQQNAHVSGDFVVWEDATKGLSDLDLYGYDLATGETRALATTTANEHLNDISGYDVAYTTNAAGNDDIVVLHVTVTPVPTSNDPCDPASGAPLLFEDTFERGEGRPHEQKAVFAAPSGMVNGTICLDLDRVASAKVELQENTIFDRSDFNATLTKLSKDVTLTESNNLEVIIFGAAHHGETYEHEPHHKHMMRGEHDGDDDGHHGDGDDGDHGDGDHGDGDHGGCNGGHDGDHDGDHTPHPHPAGGAVMHLRVVGPMPAPAACNVATTSTSVPAGALASLLMLGLVVVLPRARRQR